MDRLAEQAAECGIEASYVDGRGHARQVDARILRRIVEIVSRGQGAPARGRLPATVVLRRGHDAALTLSDVAPSAPIDWVVRSQDEELASGEGVSGAWRLPSDLPLGSFGLEVAVKSRGGRAAEHANLLVAPERAYGAQDFAGGRRLWALGVQLYALRSQRNWGHGDFTDLLALLELAAELGAAGVGISPLHALFIDAPERASPYSPNSRLFLNPLYIDLDAVPEFPGLGAAALTQEIARLRDSTMVDYTGVATAKLAGLHLAFAHFRTRGSAERRKDFDEFRRAQGRALALFASFEVLRRAHGRRWRDWPSCWRSPDEAALADLRASRSEELAFHEFVQWLAERQLRACHAKARGLRMPLGLYFDVAIGVDPDGADAWSEQSAMLADGSIGAPPDLLNTGGQNWGLVAFDPRALERQGFAPFRRMLRAAMRYAGAVRLDHVLGLNRLYLIPNGEREGSYVRFPLEAMLAVAAQESVAHRCVIIGEDLGTVPAHLRERLADWAIWSYRVMLFERDAAGSFLPPQRYAQDALVTFTTHDLPTFAGWLAGRDLQEKRAIGIDPGESEAERAAARAALVAALARQCGKLRRPSFLAVARYLAVSPSRILLISLEDALGLLDQPNLPGTIDERPNWRRRLPIALEDLRRHPRMRALARMLRRASRDAS